jgi:hypothetical protein
VTSTLASLRTRLAHLAGRVQQPLPTAWSSEPAELSLAAGFVLHQLELWASTRPGFEPMEPPTVLHQPDDADRRMAAQCPQLAALAEAHLVHAPGIVAARTAALFAMYEASGERDETIDAALANVDEQLTALLAAGVRIPEWCARWLAPLQRVS